MLNSVDEVVLAGRQQQVFFRFGVLGLPTAEQTGSLLMSGVMRCYPAEQTSVENINTTATYWKSAAMLWLSSHAAKATCFHRNQNV